MNAAQLQAALANANEDTIVHLSYVAGRPASEQGKAEFAMARDWNGDRGRPATYYIGHFRGFKTTKKGDVVLTLFCANRADVGNFRTFNPNLGTVLSVAVDPAS